ncbi:MAG: hypothetical protein LBJ03_04370 [Holosporales bacterium]|jgi:hypothetical protein|nr:hypothetical protein [Holosporales bacterium]
MKNLYAVLAFLFCLPCYSSLIICPYRQAPREALEALPSDLQAALLEAGDNVKIVIAQANNGGITGPRVVRIMQALTPEQSDELQRWGSGIKETVLKHFNEKFPEIPDHRIWLDKVLCDLNVSNLLVCQQEVFEFQHLVMDALLAYVKDSDLIDSFVRKGVFYPVDFGGATRYSFNLEAAGLDDIVQKCTPPKSLLLPCFSLPTNLFSCLSAGVPLKTGLSTYSKVLDSSLVPDVFGPSSKIVKVITPETILDSIISQVPELLVGGLPIRDLLGQPDAIILEYERLIADARYECWLDCVLYGPDFSEQKLQKEALCPMSLADSRQYGQNFLAVIKESELTYTLERSTLVLHLAVLKLAEMGRLTSNSNIIFTTEFSNPTCEVSMGLTFDSGLNEHCKYLTLNPATPQKYFETELKIFDALRHEVNHFLREVLGLQPRFDSFVPRYLEDPFLKALLLSGYDAVLGMAEETVTAVISGLPTERDTIEVVTSFMGAILKEFESRDLPIRVDGIDYRLSLNNFLLKFIVQKFFETAWQDEEEISNIIGIQLAYDNPFDLPKETDPLSSDGVLVVNMMSDLDYSLERSVLLRWTHKIDLSWNECRQTILGKMSGPGLRSAPAEELIRWYADLHLHSVK